MVYTTTFEVTQKDGMTLEQATNHIKHSGLADDDKEFMLGFLKDIEMAMGDTHS